MIPDDSFGNVGHEIGLIVVVYHDGVVAIIGDLCCGAKGGGGVFGDAFDLVFGGVAHGWRQGGGAASASAGGGNTGSVSVAAAKQGPIARVSLAATPSHCKRRAVLLEESSFDMTPHQKALNQRESQRSKLQQERYETLCGVAMRAAACVAAEVTTRDVLDRSVDVSQLMGDTFVAVLQSVPEATLNVDGRDWELWDRHVRNMGLEPWRGDIAAHRGFDTGGYWTEVVLQASVYFQVLKETMPRSQKLDAHGAVIAAKPASCTVIKTVRRVHKYFGIEMAHSKVYASVLKAAEDRFIANHGLSALVASRKLPFTNDDIRRMMSVPEGTTVWRVAVSSECRLWRSIELLIHFLAQTGFRLADALRMNWSAVMVEFRDTLFSVAHPQMLQLFMETDYSVVTPQRTKSDPLGTYWSPNPIYLDASRDALLKPGYLLAKYQCDFCITSSNRETPIFTLMSRARG